MTGEQNRQVLRPSVDGMISIRIADEIAQLRSTAEWNSGDRHAASLIKNGPLNVMLMVLKQGARLHEHRTKGPIAVQVVSGSIRFTAAGERILSGGEMIGLDRSIVHSVDAFEESAIIIIAAID